MFIELVDALRCPNAHEESWLVASTLQMDARHIVNGTLGCPVCTAEFPVRAGVVDFRQGTSAPRAASLRGDAETAMRLAALMNLTDASGFAVLCGSWGAHAQELAAIVETPIVVVDPPEGVSGSPGISVILSNGPVPLAAGAARAIAVDDGSAGQVASAIRATKAKGRVVGTPATPVPSDVSELARDDRMWVGEAGAATSPLVTLHVRRG
ncbi:MAG: hypothetical protein ABIY52_08695 [Gemmatimonadaceae bacterium]